MKCQNCKNEIPDGSEFCSKCGTKVKQNSKKTSKGKRIFYIVLLSIALIYFIAILIFGITSNKLSQTNKIAFVFSLMLLCLIGYGLVWNILKLVKKEKEYTEEQIQKRKKRKIIVSISSITAVVLVVVIMFGYNSINESKEKEQMISKIKEYRNNDYFVCTDNELQELQNHSNNDIKKVLDDIENKKKMLEEYHEKYSAALDDIYSKEIQVELYESRDQYFVYIPFNTETGEQQAKAQVECVTISKSAEQIIDIYYSVEMNLTVYNKFNGQVVSRGLTKKYYKIPNIREIENVIKINNYNDEAIQTQIKDAIQGKTGVVVATTSENKNYKYSFANIEK